MAHNPLRLWLTFLLGMAIVAGFSIASPPVARAANRTVELKATQMSYVSMAAPTENMAGVGQLVVSQTQFQTFLTFDTSAYANSTIVSADLRVAVTSSAASKPGLAVYLSEPGWSASVLTYHNRPALTSGVLTPTAAGVPKAGSILTTTLTGLAGGKVASATSLAVGYSQSLSETHLSKTTTPVLKLVVRSGTPTSAAATGTPYTPAPINTTTKKVFSHYFPPYPISFDNKPSTSDYYAKNYLSPAGENGKFRAVGGLLRDRPESRAPLSGDYRLADAITEVKQASANGIYGFMVNILGWTGDSWTSSLRMAQAASQSGTGFVAIPNVDMSASAARGSVATAAANLATFYRTPGAYRMSDGRFMLSIFKTENKTPAYYQSLISELRNTYGLNVALVGIFNSLSDEQIAAYAPVSYGLGTWGVRSAPLTLSLPNRAAAVHRFGLKWMSPIAVQDERHRTLSYAESGNTELLRASWTKAINDGADYAQVITWNDYSESSGFAPSASHRSSFLDLNGYYLKQFKTGLPTTLTGDELIVTHRIQKTTTQPRLQSAQMDYTLSGSRTLPRDTVEVVCLCKSAATVSLTVGETTVSYAAPAGVSAKTVPLQTGVTISAKAVRDETTVAATTSPYAVVSAIEFWDLQYYAASSRQNP
jgi:hypothetical protein